MKIAFGSDHGGLKLKEQLIDYLRGEHEVVDLGTNSLESCDYVDYAVLVAKEVANKSCDYGIVLCTTGIGVSMAANKIQGIRCALVYNKEYARLTRAHNDANCLALSEKATSFEEAKQIVDVFLQTSFDGGRHQRRVDKLNSI